MENETLWWTGRKYSHIKVPKALFKNPLYENISPLAKLLYGFLLDRTSLSYANGEDWLNENGDAFVYYPITEIMERFGCGHDKAAALLQELERAGLISRTLKGRGRPYRIVVRPFAMSPEDQKPTARNYRTADLENPDRNKPKINLIGIILTQSLPLIGRAWRCRSRKISAMRFFLSRYLKSCWMVSWM